MNARTKVLKELVGDGLYMIDESAVAGAILLRSAARRTLPDLSFRSAGSRTPPKVRSFRPHRGARSFRLTRAERRPLAVRSADGDVAAHR